ncbi:hypothetical protein PanWU01x14_109640 [Parasponia andersonii]|uniref:Uncharacterized protein n=1 Tax=Parasponia andersonii TaxID=3476 RepID=A0A2P5CZR0_PARAD|nr:hypothetical protein PanWU01x14_109640 [Parasponia andersonii]
MKMLIKHRRYFSSFSVVLLLCLFVCVRSLDENWASKPGSSPNIWAPGSSGSLSTKMSRAGLDWASQRNSPILSSPFNKCSHFHNTIAKWPGILFSINFIYGIQLFKKADILIYNT